ncbi:MAG TPA: alpha/beta fold hydrolase [Candidatus Acidoferrales bacterium]|nr:alpha/beta fold hydrolase [Candidatus Acidoferrales bacterium]
MYLSGRSILYPKRRPRAANRLFCFPHAGVGPSVFRGWADQLTSDTEVCLVQIPGREGRLREAPYSSIGALLPGLIEDMSGLLDRPFAFYGHSLGATVAFECALNLRRNLRLEPVHIFVGASQAPQLPWEHSPMRALPEDAFLSEMAERYGALPAEVISDTEMRALIVPILRADISMIEKYVHLPESPLSCDMTVFGGLRDHMVQRHELESWRELTTGRFRLQMLDGNHLFLKSHKDHLLQLIAGEMNQYRALGSRTNGLKETRI